MYTQCINRICLCGALNWLQSIKEANETSSNTAQNQIQQTQYNSLL